MPEHLDQPSLETGTQNDADRKLAFAGFGLRLVAYLIDVLPITLLLALVYYWFLGFDETLQRYVNRVTDDLDARVEFLSQRNQIRDLSLLVYILYCTVLEASAWQGTIGKRLLGLRVTDGWGQRLTIGRSFVRNSAKIPLAVGFFCVLFSKQKRGWHDMFARTLVVKSTPTVPSSIHPSVPGWTWVEPYEGMQMYRDADGDALSLAPGQVIPDLASEDDLRNDARDLAEGMGAGLIEAAAVASEHGPALMLIYKRLDKPAFIFTGMLVIPRGDTSWVWTLVAREHGMTGIREAIVTAELMEAGKLTLESYNTSWAQDPYDPSYDGVDRSNLRYMSDATDYDRQFPHHPLSKVRRELRKLLGVQLDQASRSEPTFHAASNQSQMTSICSCTD